MGMDERVCCGEERGFERAMMAGVPAIKAYAWDIYSKIHARTIFGYIS